MDDYDEDLLGSITRPSLEEDYEYEDEFDDEEEGSQSVEVAEQPIEEATIVEKEDIEKEETVEGIAPLELANVEEGWFVEVRKDDVVVVDSGEEAPKRKPRPPKFKRKALPLPEGLPSSYRENPRPPSSERPSQHARRPSTQNDDDDKEKNDDEGTSASSSDAEAKEEFAVERLQATNAQLRRQLTTFRDVLQKSLDTPRKPAAAKPKRQRLVSPFHDAVAAKQIELAHKKLRACERENEALKRRLVEHRDDEKAVLRLRVAELEKSLSDARDERRILETAQRRGDTMRKPPPTNLEAELKVAVEQRRRAESERAQCQKRETELRAEVQRLKEDQHHRHPTPRSPTPSFDSQKFEAHIQSLRIALERLQNRCARQVADAKQRDETQRAEIERLQALVDKREKDYRLQQTAVAKLKANLCKLADRYHKIKNATVAPSNHANKVVLQALRRPTVTDDDDDDDDDDKLFAEEELQQPHHIPMRIRGSPRTAKIRSNNNNS